jgi:multidrug transporter EmrE-like cation transporter
MRLLLALIPTVTLVVISQLVTKWRVVFLFDSFQNPLGRLERLFVYLKDPYILISYLAALCASVSWMFVVERYALSIAFPLYIGITVLSVVITGKILFGEQLTYLQVIAILLIIIGVALGSQS